MPISLNLLGLLFNIVGTVVLWRYGLPATISPDGSVKITKVWNGEQTPSMKKTERRVRHGRLAQHLGLGMILVGFSIQAYVEIFTH